MSVNISLQVEVNGSGTSPVYELLKGAQNVNKIQWNFEVRIGRFKRKI